MLKRLVLSCLLLTSVTAFAPVRPSLTSQAFGVKEVKEHVGQAWQVDMVSRGGALNAITVPGWGEFG